MEFGRWLDDQLKRRNLTMTEFGERIGVSQTSVSRWIKGERRPDTVSCDRIARVLDVPANEVFVLAGHPQVQQERIERLRAELAQLHSEHEHVEDQLNLLHTRLEELKQQITKQRELIRAAEAEEHADWETVFKSIAGSHELRAFAYRALTHIDPSEIQHWASQSEHVLHAAPTLPPRMGNADRERLREVVVRLLPKAWSYDQKMRFADGLEIGQLLSLQGLRTRNEQESTVEQSSDSESTGSQKQNRVE